MIIEKDIKDYRNVGDYAYTILRTNILNLHFKPGQKISEVEVSEFLNISRTPVREAIIRLVQERLCYVQPQRGTFVSKIDLSLVEEARFVRRSLEEKIVLLAIQHFTQKDIEDCFSILEDHKKIPQDDFEEHFYYDELFHRQLYMICGKSRAWDMIKVFDWDYLRIRYLALVDLTKSPSIIQEHEAILTAITNKDPALAIAITLAHLDRWSVESTLVSERHLEYFKV
ncbi:MAG: GntR family transcriptional regulator [Brevinema sp.]